MKTWITLLLLWMTAYPACADYFQDQITKYFPGFVIMGFTEFDPDIRKNLESNPSFFTGNFDLDEFEDFAALIRDTSKHRYITRELSYDYYEARLVVCHGRGKRKYKCKSIFSGVTLPPEHRYLIKRPPGKIKCRSPQGEFLEAKTEFIGWASVKGWVTGTGETQYVYQPGGSYMKCGDDN